jgi:uncharacterized protein (TIGR03000 family)
MSWRSALLATGVQLTALCAAVAPASALPYHYGWGGHGGGWGGYGWGWSGYYRPAYYGYGWTYPQSYTSPYGYYSPGVYGYNYPGVYGYGPYALGSPAAAGYAAYDYYPAADVEDRSIAPAGYEQDADDNSAHLRVHVPANAELTFDGTATRQTGTDRVFVTPPLNPGKNYTYDVRVRWTEDGKTVERNRTVRVRANDWQDVDMTRADDAAPRR